MKLRHVLLLCLSVLQTFITKAQCPPPDNDNYSDAITLSISNNGTIGSTCCASGYNEDPVADLPNAKCESDFQYNSVWYKYVTGQEDWIAVNFYILNDNEFDENMSLEIYSGTNIAPSTNLFNPNAYICGGNYRPINLGCFSAGETIWFKVSNKEGFCHDFNLSLTNPQEGDCAVDDECVDVWNIITMSNSDPNCGDSPFTQVAGCLTFACPETIISTCGADVLPTVWYQVEVDSNATQLQAYFSTNGEWLPIMSIYSGTCDDLTLVQGGIPTQPLSCSGTDSNSNNTFSIGILKGIYRYYIAISGQGLIDDPYFNLSLKQVSGCVLCLGDQETPTVTEFTISQRSSNRSLDDPLFDPGETVTICLDFQYDASESGSDGLHGIIPDFGPGWDMTAFDPMAVIVTPDSVTWHAPTDSLCAAYATEQLPILCTYFDSLTQSLKICNTFTDNCPCSAPIKRGAILPGGWFWNRDVSPDDMESCSPSKHYGLSAVVADVHFCFNMKVKEILPEDNFELIKDLHVNFQTTSAGVTGCWNDPVAECKLDFAQKGPNWKITCGDTNTPPVTGEINSEVCTNNALNLELSVNAPDSFNIDVIAIPNPLIIGAKAHYFVDNQGIINDTLINVSSTVQIQTYVATSIVKRQDCKYYRDTFFVKVYPRLNVFLPISFCVDEIFDTNNANATNWISSDTSIASVTTNGQIRALKPGKVSFTYNYMGTDCTNTSDIKDVFANPIAMIEGDSSVCQGTLTMLTASGGIIYNWANGATTPNIFFNPPGQITVTVTDANGCSASATQITTLKDNPLVSISGNNVICIGGITTLSPNSGGTWASANLGIATVNNEGVVTGVSFGTATFKFTDASTGCISSPTDTIIVSEIIPAFFTGPSEICVGETTTVIPNSGGTWVSSNLGVAVVSNSGVVTGVSVGTAFLSLNFNQDCFSSPLKVTVKSEECEPTAVRSDLNIFSFVDYNSNGVFDINIDSKLPNCNISVAGSNYNGITDGNGNLVVRLDTGFYELTYQMPFGQWSNSPIIKDIQLNQAIQFDTVGFIPKAPAIVGKAIINPTWLRCNMTTRLHAYAKNTGNIKSSGRFVVVLDDKTSSDFASPFPLNQANNRFEWSFQNLNPGQDFKTFLDVKIPDVSFEFDTLTFLAFLISVDGDTVSQFKYSGIIRCSYDPNDKRSWPDRIGEDNYTLRSERIDYTIRFQNNGNDTAFYVKIVDVLDPSLDKKSLIVNGSSHEVSTFILGDTLVFEHNDIILPDTASNFIESQGFVSFSFASLPDVPQGTNVFNKGEIIFDQNAPIITNQVKNTIVDALPCPLEAIWLLDNSINVNEEGSYYEWYECNTNVLVNTTTVATFTPEMTGSYYAVISGDFCKTITACVTFVISSSTQMETNNVKIFPNPNQGEFTIISQESIKNIIVRDHVGKEIQNIPYFDFTDHRKVSIRSLTPGMYILNVTTEMGNHLIKVIVH
jgi:uncharacterized repeat protein (TIGR01451 family)